jgi:hypothetical protein
LKKKRKMQSNICDVLFPIELSQSDQIVLFETEIGKIVCNFHDSYIFKDPLGEINKKIIMSTPPLTISVTNELNL